MLTQKAYKEFVVKVKVGEPRFQKKICNIGWQATCNFIEVPQNLAQLGSKPWEAELSFSLLHF